MKNSIQESSISKTKGHGSSALVALSGKRSQVFVLILFMIFICMDQQAASAQPPQVKTPIPGDVKKDASQRTVLLEYKLAREKAKETGIFLSDDSAALITPGQASRYRPAVYNEAGHSFRVDFDKLEPDSRYFYKIFIRDPQNRITWSEITPIRTPGFNIRWTGAQKWMTANNTTQIMLTGESVDITPGYYQVFYGGMPCELLRITSSPDTVQSHYIIRLPRTIPPGRHRLVMMYKQKKIFEQDIEVL